MKRALPSLFLHAVLVAGAALTLAPLLWMVSASFMPSGEANTFPPRLLPSVPTVRHYVDLFVRLDLGRQFANSTLVAVVSTFISLVVNSMAGYAFAKKKFPGSNLFFWMILAALMIPGQVTLVPLYLMINKLKLVNTFAGVILPGLADVIGIFLLKQFIQT